MIQDIYSEDVELQDYDNNAYASPTPQAEEKLNPVIEESQEYSVTPSRII
jgi:hypothetical protein